MRNWFQWVDTALSIILHATLICTIVDRLRVTASDWERESKLEFMEPSSLVFLSRSLTERLAESNRTAGNSYMNIIISNKSARENHLLITPARWSSNDVSKWWCIARIPGRKNAIKEGRKRKMGNTFKVIKQLNQSEWCHTAPRISWEDQEREKLLNVLYTYVQRGDGNVTSNRLCIEGISFSFLMLTSFSSYPEAWPPTQHYQAGEVDGLESKQAQFLNHADIGAEENM